MNARETYKLIHSILIEQQERYVEPTLNVSSSLNTIKNDPKLLAIRKKAAELSVHAELERSKNQMKKAKLDRTKIANEEEKLQEELSSDQNNKEQKIAATYPRNPKDEDLNSGDPINKKKVNKQVESINEAPEDEEDPSIDNEEDLEQLPPDAEEDIPQVEIAGDVPQTEEEAKIANIQAKTREIQANIGEYSPPSSGDMDPSMTEDSGMDGQNIDPMTGMPMQEPEPPDPMKGFGDTTDPQAQQNIMNGMGNIDPMTGQPMEDTPSKTSSALGRLFMLKKIYTKLSVLDKILTNCPDPEINSLREEAKEAFEVFKLIINNLKSFKEKADEIIVDFYMFVRDVSEKLETHFKHKKMMSED